MIFIPIIIFALLQVGCSSQAANDSGDSSSGPIRNGRSVTSADKSYLDLQPSISSAGDKLVFLSSRGDHLGFLRAYKYDVGTEAVTRLTALAAGNEVKVVLSGDGSKAAVYSVEDSGNKLQVYKYDDPNKPYSLVTGLESLEIIGFSPSSSEILAVRGVTSEGTAELQIFKVSEPEEPEKAKDYSPLESGFVWIKNSNDKYGLLSLKTGKYMFREVPEPGDPQALYTESFSKLSGAPVLGSKPQVAYSDISLFALKRSTGKSFVPSGNRVSKVSAFSTRVAQKYELSNADVSEVQTEQLTINEIWSDDEKFVALGSDLFSCEGTEEDIFGTSFFIYQGDGKTSKFIIKDEYSLDNKDVTRQIISTDFCTHFDTSKPGDEQVFDFQISGLAMARSSDKLTMVIQSWHRGDEEVYLLQADVTDGVVQGPGTFTEVSNNLRP